MNDDRLNNCTRLLAGILANPESIRNGKEVERAVRLEAEIANEIVRVEKLEKSASIKNGR